MPYLDGSPKPGDDKIEQIAERPVGQIIIDANDPEAMFAALALAIFRINGRKITGMRIEWVDMTDADSTSPDHRPRLVDMDSVMLIPINPNVEGFHLG